MATTDESREAHHSRARSAALGWAERAEDEYEESRHYADQARADEKQPFRDPAGYRKQQREHAELAADARAMAEMWARVAALYPAPPES
ncbi:hypothetical protein ACWDX8_13325 [Streptomyces anthocyanicus]|uniref:hypothetical protein n=1 Tax=Streptomyces anthocyanicus TaxID=68174 RepID=UPI0036646972